jgi:hypothetical protein
MLDPFEELILYLRLAQAYRNKLQMSDRDRALLLAGTCAHVMQMPQIGQFCRQLILQNNQGHMLRKYESFEEAVNDSDFGFFLKQVRRKISPERAEAQLIDLEYHCDVRREDYPTDEQYAAAVMGVDADWIRENFG